MSASLKPLKELGEPTEVKFTETVVLVVSMHGGYDVIKEGERTIDIPSFPISSLSKDLENPVTGEIFKNSTEPIRSLRTITAAPVGVAFYYKPELMKEYIREILSEFYQYRPWRLSKDEDKERQVQLDKVTKDISELLKKTDKKRIVTDELLTRKAIKRKSDTEEELTEKKDSFIYHSDKMYLTRTYRSDNPSQSKIRDKEFQKVEEKEIEGKYDNRITVLNMPGQPDLLDDEVFPTFERKYDSRVTIHEILNYLYSQGVNNVILVDFTCSHCDFGTTSPRTLRNLRRKFGGRKKKTLKKKTTTLRRKKSRKV